MKKLLVVIIALLPLFASAQVNWPDCNTMVVNNVQLQNDSIKVTIQNNCTDCNAGMDGPVYCEMQVIRTVAPYDTMGRSACYCFITPNNQSALTYTIAAATQALPGYSDMQVVLYCGSGTCEVIPFALNVGLNENAQGAITAYPNPASDFIIINGLAAGCTIQIIDATGKQIQHTQLNSNRLDISLLPKGLYFAQVIECYQYITVAKFVKE